MLWGFLLAELAPPGLLRLGVSGHVFFRYVRRFLLGFYGMLLGVYFVLGLPDYHVISEFGAGDFLSLCL